MEEETPMLGQLIAASEKGGAAGSGLQPLPLEISDVERFRYRVEDVKCGLTKKVVAKFRARELQQEALNNDRLKAYFEEHPEEKLALQQSQRKLKEGKNTKSHL